MELFLKGCKEFDVDIEDFYRYLMRRYRSEIFELEITVIGIALVIYSFNDKLILQIAVACLSALAFLQLVKRKVCRRLDASSEDIINYFRTRKNFEGILIRFETYVKLIKRIKDKE